jgi:hypothetical protein
MTGRQAMLATSAPGACLLLVAVSCHDCCTSQGCLPHVHGKLPRCHWMDAVRPRNVTGQQHCCCRLQHSPPCFRHVWSPQKRPVPPCEAASVLQFSECRGGHMRLAVTRSAISPASVTPVLLGDQMAHRKERLCRCSCKQGDLPERSAQLRVCHVHNRWRCHTLAMTAPTCCWGCDGSVGQAMNAGVLFTSAGCVACC